MWLEHAEETYKKEAIGNVRDNMKCLKPKEECEAWIGRQEDRRRLRDGHSCTSEAA
jgi:hypothetical protein